MPAPTDALRVRAYNVRFGDALLVSVPDRDAAGAVTVRHVLIDVGNVLAGSGGEDEVFAPVLADVVAELDGEPLDLYVMTHEHMDHVQGLLWAKQKQGIDLKARHAWLTASAAPDYYEHHPEARKKRLAMEAEYRRIALFLSAAAREPGPVVRALLLNNNPRSTADCVAHLRGVGETTTYVHRGADLAGAHPFAEARFAIWGPEEDTSIYYGAFRPLALGLAAAGGGGAAAEGAAAAAGAGAEAPPRLVTPLPPPGVDGEAFYNLVERRRSGVFDNLLAIDKAANNSSVVFSLEWRNWRLLFPGDAEERAWQEMGKLDPSPLEPVHFLKVGHHGSHNGTPTGALLERILPLQALDARPRSALVSTHDGTYSGVPHAETLAEIAERCDPVVRIGEDGDALFTDLLFPG
jgi:beta-lactamase superfamily II metal-dependent hydrolase